MFEHKLCLFWAKEPRFKLQSISDCAISMENHSEKVVTNFQTLVGFLVQSVFEYREDPYGRPVKNVFSPLFLWFMESAQNIVTLMNIIKYETLKGGPFRGAYSRHCGACMHPLCLPTRCTQLVCSPYIYHLSTKPFTTKPIICNIYTHMHT